MSESATHDAIEAVARDSYGRLVAYIALRTGDIANAQDALSEALAAALENWPTAPRYQRPGCASNQTSSSSFWQAGSDWTETTQVDNSGSDSNSPAKSG